MILCLYVISVKFKEDAEDEDIYIVDHLSIIVKCSTFAVDTDVGEGIFLMLVSSVWAQLQPADGFTDALWRNSPAGGDTDQAWKWYRNTSVGILLP